MTAAFLPKFDERKLFRSITAALGRSPCPVEVLLGTGDEAFATARAILVPMRREDNADYRLGFLHHEIAHIRYTDFDLVPAEAILNGMWNAIEDPRIERLYGREYPGALRHINKLIQWFKDKGRFTPRNPTPELALSFYVLAQMRNRVNGGLEDLIETNARIAGQFVPQSLLDQVDEILTRQWPDSTEQAVEMATTILALLKQAQKANSQPSQKQSEKHVSVDCEGDSPTRAEANSESDVETRNTFNAVERETSSNDEEMPRTQQADSNLSESFEDTDISLDEPNGQEGESSGEMTNLPETLGQDPASTIPSGSEADQPAPASTREASGDWTDLGHILCQELGWRRGDKMPLSSTIQVVIKTDGGANQDSLPISRQLVREISSSVEDLVCARVQKPARLGHSGRFSSRHLAGLFTGEPTFLRKIPSDGRDTHLMLLLDQSGSTCEIVNGKSILSTGQETAMAIMAACLSLDETRVSCLAYCRNYHDHLQLTTVEQKSAPLAAIGYTPTGDAMLAAAEMFDSDMSRHVLLVITDGEPDQAHRDITEALERRGIEVYGLGIEVPDAAMASNFNRFTVTTNHRISRAIADLASKILHT